jgi:hypothetical protein
MKKWQQHIIQGEGGKRIVVNYCARLEFQDGKRKQPKHNYNPDQSAERSYGRGAVHMHLLLWFEDGDVSCLKLTWHIPTSVCMSSSISKHSKEFQTNKNQKCNFSII